jgi:hypothetical protein
MPAAVCHNARWPYYINATQDQKTEALQLSFQQCGACVMCFSVIALPQNHNLRKVSWMHALPECPCTSWQTWSRQQKTGACTVPLQALHSTTLGECAPRCTCYMVSLQPRVHIAQQSRKLRCLAAARCAASLIEVTDTSMQSDNSHEQAWAACRVAGAQRRLQRRQHTDLPTA